VEPAEYIEALATEGYRLADTASALDLASPVPTCPGWVLRDLLQHLGGVHRWAGAHLRDRRESILRVDDFQDLVGPWPPDNGLVAWYRSELELLIHTLRSAPLDIECAVFLKSTSPLAHWVRRQAHETAIHRADVESIVGTQTPVDIEFALDGIDELVDCFVPRPFMKLRSKNPTTLGIAPGDSDRFWALSISEGPVQVTTVRRECDCVIEGSASDVYFALWNRSDDRGIRVSGDRSVRDLFRSIVTIKWA
jgi:uncharacterized protein (TIGR03083 family)